MKLIGNENMLSQIRVSYKSASIENRSLPHMLLSGAAGCGKTSTARYVAELTGGDLVQVTPEVIKTRGDILEIAKTLNKEGWDQYGDKINRIRPTTIFIDEVHRLPITGQEHLGIMMEEWIIPVKKEEIGSALIGKFKNDTSAKGRWCPRFTLIGATTNDGLLSKPFKDRFKVKFIFTTYNEKESTEIVKVHAERMNLQVTEKAAAEIAKRGRGVPRILVSLLERCRDSAIVAHFAGLKDRVINTAVVLATFGMMGVDLHGLTPIDIKILKILYNSKSPVGLDNLAIMTNESSKTIVDTIEPFLIQQELITRSPRGRILTERGRKYLIDHNHIDSEAGENMQIDIPLTYKRRI